MITFNANTQASKVANQVDLVQELMSRSIAKLSSGNNIIAPADNSVGIASAQKYSAQSKRIQSALTNIQNATSYLQTGDGALDNMQNILNRMSELGIMASDPTKTAGDRSLYQAEFKELQDQLRTTVGGTTAQIGGTYDIAKPSGSFAGVALFGPNPGGILVATGADSSETTVIPETNLRTGAMLAVMQQDSSGNYALTVSDPTLITQVTNALQQLGGARATVGAVTSRFNLIAANLTTRGQNLDSAVSNIQDVDVAAESTQLAKLQVLAQSSAAMFSQANHSSDSVLQFLQSVSR